MVKSIRFRLQSRRTPPPPVRPWSPPSNLPPSPPPTREELIDYHRRRAAQKRLVSTYPQRSDQDPEVVAMREEDPWFPEAVVDHPGSHLPLSMEGRMSHLEDRWRNDNPRLSRPHRSIRPLPSCLKKSSSDLPEEPSSDPPEEPRCAKRVRFNLLGSTHVADGAADVVLGVDVATDDVYWPRRRFIDHSMDDRRDLSSPALPRYFYGNWDAMANRARNWVVCIYEEELPEPTSKRRI
ncbi:hypothetical protein QBC38DRAFT_446490 [Podospora fimiseda]|uniref:Uncharacterized protein n=1 Tax=Podospora fimiseda TaxID=252190 RepID=A0AAN7GQ62_9PEZI|nr:hypothetical protein QBC38DRAFT_446490 [Podospora fimiseda]